MYGENKKYMTEKRKKETREVEARVAAHTEEISKIVTAHKVKMQDYMNDHTGKLSQMNESEVEVLKADKENIENELQSSLVAHSDEVIVLRMSDRSSLASKLREHKQKLEGILSQHLGKWEKVGSYEMEIASLRADKKRLGESYSKLVWEYEEISRQFGVTRSHLHLLNEEKEMALLRAEIGRAHV
jgi:hypothetical protein